MTSPLHHSVITRAAIARQRELCETRRQRVAQHSLDALEDFEPRNLSDLKGCAMMLVCSFLGSLVWIALAYVIFSSL
jgi:hypothetical protein